MTEALHRLLFYLLRVIITSMKKPKKIAAVFDLDGTLIDSMEIWREIDEEFFAKRGLSVPDRYQEKIAHLGFKECARFTAENYLPDESEENMIEEWKALSHSKYAAKDGGKYFKKGAAEFVRFLYGQGVRLAVATASSAELFMPVLRAGEIAECFSCFVTVDEAGKNKSFSDIFHLAAKKIGVAEENCIVFEDNLSAIRAAKAAGMRTVGVYDAASRLLREDIERTADFYIDSFTEIPESLKTILLAENE